MQVITKQIEGHKCEPYEEAVIEVPEEHVGPVVDMLGQRKGQMLDLVAGDNGGLTRSRLSHVTCRTMRLLGSNGIHLQLGTESFPENCIHVRPCW